MSWDLTNKVVVITGGAGGIGFAIADKYLHNSAKTLIIVDINEDLGSAAVKKLTAKYGDNKAVFIKCDVATNVKTIFEKIFDLYSVDVLVNSAGVLHHALAKRVINVNVTGLIECCLTFWEHVRKDKGGSGGTIINIASLAAFKPYPYFPIYQASKFAALGFTRSLGHITNSGRSGVRVIAICPGCTETALIENLSAWDDALNDEFDEILEAMPKQNVDSVADAAVEVYQKANSGSAWVIDGGEPVFELTE